MERAPEDKDPLHLTGCGGSSHPGLGARSSAADQSQIERSRAGSGSGNAADPGSMPSSVHDHHTTSVPVFGYGQTPQRPWKPEIPSPLAWSHPPPPPMEPVSENDRPPSSLTAP